MPRVSIVIPCHNQTAYLRPCLASVLQQRFADWEAIVVDDGSRDGDPAAIAKSLHDKRIRSIMFKENRGLARARNAGLSRARADWAALLDADDKLHPAFLEETLAATRRKAGCDVCFPDFWLFGDRTGLWETAAQDARQFLQRRRMPGAGLLIRRRLWERVGGYCEAAELRAGQEDTDFWLAALTDGAAVAHVSGPLYLYRRHKGSLTARVPPDYWRARRFIYRRHRRLIDGLGFRRKFLADSRWRAAVGRWAQAQPAQAWALVLRACWIAWPETGFRFWPAAGELRRALARRAFYFPPYQRDPRR